MASFDVLTITTDKGLIQSDAGFRGTSLSVWEWNLSHRRCMRSQARGWAQRRWALSEGASLKGTPCSPNKWAAYVRAYNITKLCKWICCYTTILLLSKHMQLHTNTQTLTGMLKWTGIQESGHPRNCVYAHYPSSLQKASRSRCIKHPFSLFFSGWWGLPEIFWRIMHYQDLRSGPNAVWPRSAGP